MYVCIYVSTYVSSADLSFLFAKFRLAIKETDISWHFPTNANIFAWFQQIFFYGQTWQMIENPKFIE